MGLAINVVSEAKGSNHGGRCIVHEHGDSLPKPYYIKHCSGTRIPKGTSWLNHLHQPIYEAVTNEMAIVLGLETPNFYVICNAGGDVLFIKENVQKCDIRPNYPFYFASELLMPPIREDMLKANLAIKEEEFYRDLLMISDIVGRKQNYSYDETIDRVIYLDLGCSFVDAHMNVIELKKHHKDPLKHKDLKRARSMFQKYQIKTKNTKRPVISLDDFVNLPYDMTILTLNPKGKVRLDQLISATEIEEIVGRIAAELYYGNVLRRNKDNFQLQRVYH